MENVKHLKNIAIQNFKCFDKLTLENFEKFNIILGDNNVGKTSFLEMLLFDKNITQTIHNFQSLLYFRKIFSEGKYYEINPFSFFINRFSGQNEINVKSKFSNNEILELIYETVNVDDLSVDERNKFNKFFNISSKPEKEILKVQNNNNIEYRRFWTNQNFEPFNSFIPFVYSGAYYDQDLIGFYSDNFSENREDKKKLIKQFEFLIPGLVDIEITLNNNKNPAIGFWISNNKKESLIPLALFGDGTIRLFRLIMEIIMCSNEYVCIDEIDTGIHYSKFKDFSKVVILTANENKVQLFITTHNNEFLKAFKEVLEEDNFKIYQKETKCFSLKKLPKGDIKAYSYNFDEFEFAIEQENELR